MTVFQDSPIYSRLVAERGDVPAQVRSEAERTLRDLAQVMRLGQTPSSGIPERAQPPTPSSPAWRQTAP